MRGIQTIDRPTNDAVVRQLDNRQMYQRLPRDSGSSELSIPGFLLCQVGSFADGKETNIKGTSASLSWSGASDK